ALEELGLIQALEMQLRAIQPAQIKLRTHGEIRRLEEQLELTLFRAAQEAFRNITRHTQAQHIQVDVHYQSQGVALQIQDDGCGFKPP
ncbi:ATP-binding protein, partial [Klebsiella quasipneumoniae]|uniref:ATP-binding protein n=1 Tax=Klebsiella quasipneumoniae TaxID=1463165 RepID=UPI002765CB1E|nr:hypothetical protein [Klebsiella quasipneumoniae]